MLRYTARIAGGRARQLLVRGRRFGVGVPPLPRLRVRLQGRRTFGEFGEKIESDPEWQKFWAGAVANLSADLLQNSVISEAPGL